MKMQISSGRFLLEGMLLVYILISGGSVSAQIISAGDIRINGISVNISSGASVALAQGMSVSDDSQFRNEGLFYFINKQEETLDINTFLEGSGIYYILGEDDYTLKGDGAKISSLTVDGGNTLRLESDLSIENILNLKNGVIEVPEGGELIIQSTESGAVSFNNTEYNTSFINGKLVRNTVQDVGYSFPVGTGINGFHPFWVNSVSSSGYIGVTYKPDFLDTWGGSENSFQLETTGAWEVATEKNNLSFIPGLSLYNNYGILDDNYNIFYSANPEGSPSEFSLDFNSGVQDTYLSTTTYYTAGTFALAKVTSNSEEIDGVRVPELVNFLVIDGTGRTTFEIPGLQNYKKVSLSVYNRFGNLVYQSGNYWNDFDVRNYRSGTYFYEITFETHEGKRAMVRNSIEIMEHN